MIETASGSLRSFLHLVFGIVSNFDIRISNFPQLNHTANVKKSLPKTRWNRRDLRVPSVMAPPSRSDEALAR
jgi:hypothetical protein